ncbi:hypothetical protein RMATCC62417_04239 [Rhizopus microsporus]|nr:hypothetical protein RMATCC62417_04239 [Rhizopus microsporus]
MLLQNTEPLLPSNYKKKEDSLDTHARALDYVGDIVNEEVGQLRKDKDHTSPVSGTAANEKENILPLQAEISEGASEKQASTSSAFNENEEAETESQTTVILNPYKGSSRFETSQDGNVYKLFDIYQAEATKLSIQYRKS